MMHYDGRVAIKGWYDGKEVSDEVRKILQALPDDERAIYIEGIKTIVAILSQDF